MIGIVIATYGDGWIGQHKEMFYTAMQSAMSQTIPVDVVWEHGPTLHEARNRGARHSKGDRLVFLDADDWLDIDFAEKIVETEDILQPKTSYWKEDKMVVGPGYLQPYDDFSAGNHLIVGCPVNKELFMDVGGFEDYPVFEDWALWWKMEKAGATFGKTTGVYNIRIRDASRNHVDNWGDIFGKIRGIYG